MTTPEVIKDAKVRYILDRYLDKILQEFAPSEMWLFGSRVHGFPDEYSDVDMILVSERFHGVPFFDRRNLFREKIGVDWDRSAETVDVLCYTAEEFEHKRSAPTIVREAVEKGVRVA